MFKHLVCLSVFMSFNLPECSYVVDMFQLAAA